MNTELLKQAIASATKLRELEEKKAELQALLEKSLHIALLWPDVFEHGALRAGWVGVAADPMAVKLGRPEHLYHMYRISAGNGEVRNFPFEQVSTLLGGGLQV